MPEIKESTVEEEIVALDAEIKSKEGKLAEESATPLSQGDITFTTAEELVSKEQRKAIRSHLVSTAKIKRLELRKRRYKPHAMG